MNTLEITELGKKVSQDFTERNTSMTESLVKIAQDKQVNKNQLQRIAEIANQETYLKLIKTASEGYVEFDVADFNKAWTTTHEMKKEASLVFDNDYQNIVRDYSGSMEKVAEEINPLQEKEEEYALNEKAEYLKGNVQLLSNMLLEKQASFQKELNSTLNTCKQLIASRENDYSEIKAVLETEAYHIKEALLKDVEEQLQPLFPLEDFSKVAACKTKKINRKSELAKKANALQKLAFEMKDVISLLENQSDELTKIAGKKLRTAGKVLLVASVPAAFMYGKYTGSKKEDDLALDYPTAAYVAAKQKELKNAGY